MGPVHRGAPAGAGGPRLAALSVDLDEVPCYSAIHGLPVPTGDAAHAIYRHALPRFEALFDDEDIRATFFAVGADLADARAGAAITRLHGAGHEIGNHTQDHRYDFSRADDVRIAQQVADAAAAIEARTGARPVGFRSPGYTTNDRVQAVLRAQGYRYDSSVFPCPSYYTAKAAAMAVIRARGRRSHSVLDSPQVLRAPADPYRAGQPYYRRGEGLLQLPIGVTRDATGRLPYIGTSLSLLGAGALTRAVIGRPLVNLELHGIDLADTEADGLSSLAPHQPDLRHPLARRLAALRQAISALRAAGYRFVTLADAAVHFG